MARFCTQCGSQVAEGLAFCVQCGAAQSAPASDAKPIPPASSVTVPPPPPPPQAVTNTSPPPATYPPQAAPPIPPTPKAGSSILKIVAIVLGILALITVVGIGSCVYIGYRVERKAEQVAKEIKEGAEPGRQEQENTRTVPALPCPNMDPAQSQAFRT